MQQYMQVKYHQYMNLIHIKALALKGILCTTVIAFSTGYTNVDSPHTGVVGVTEGNGPTIFFIVTV